MPHDNLDRQDRLVRDTGVLRGGFARTSAGSYSGGNIEDALHDPSGARKMTVSSRCSVRAD